MPAAAAPPLVPRSRLEALLNAHGPDAPPADGAWRCILYVGIDRLGAINDACGYAVGDAVLEAAARRLGERTEGLVAMCRAAGDEFALYVDLPPVEGRQVAARLVAEFVQGIDVAGRRRSIGLSIGIAAAQRHDASAGLVRCAAIAMRSVKARGGAAYAVFDRVAQAREEDDLALARELRHAVARGQLRLVFQPKVDAIALQVTAVEALLRWDHPALGTVPPSVFVPIAERFGMIDLVGDWVMEHALAQAAQWRKLGLYMRVAINVSGLQLQREDFAARLEQRLAAHDLPPSRFTCEVTESVAAAGSANAAQALARLRRIGVHVSIDDFGTGYSSLASLCRLPMHELKLDRSFVADVARSAAARVVVRSIVEMAHALQLRVVAEGVETTLQRDRMLEAGCDELQGYYIARPMSARAIAVWACDHRGSAGQAFKPSLFEEEDSGPGGAGR